MHRIVRVFVCVVLLLGFTACAKRSRLVGTVVDAQDKPLPGLKITANQIHPVKGYGKFEAVSNSDGAFEFEKLYPMSDYVLRPQSDNWMTDAKLGVKTAPDGEIAVLPQPLKIRFTNSREGVITDSLTALEWIVGPDRDMDWNAADRWVKELPQAGGRWRMPTQAELKSLYDEGSSSEYKIFPVFNLRACCVWTGEKRDASTAGNFSFKPRIRELGNLNNSYLNRAFAVRPR